MQTPKICNTCETVAHCSRHGCIPITSSTGAAEQPGAAAPAVAADPSPELQRMTAHRATFFLERFLREEKLLGPNEQAAVRFAVAALSAPQAQQPGAAPAFGRWINADDVDRLARALDVAFNGEAGAALQARLCDVVSQIEREANDADRPLLDVLRAARTGAHAAPAIWVSPGQLANHADPDDTSGSYLPARRTPIGKFTQPLYTEASATRPSKPHDAAEAITPSDTENRSQWLSPEDMAALERLDETFSDGEGYDLPKSQMVRLADLGVVRHHSAGRYSITSFGRWVLGSRVLRKPLETADECNARLGEEHRARLAAEHPAQATPHEGGN
ncbi:hypothetical protein [Paracidovorax wautersii]|uniref:Uncharacterized protein n=1 Tax=Paracidovorax wautersii TaxID=1177982 RepID=A0A1I2E5Y5_9BURK|nr:hypothetical protein [Paracidovorax wautersii]SFE88039.1 hypothetical protein SAMN04489711_106238 [Paracidovorax wautersii]